MPGRSTQTSRIPFFDAAPVEQARLESAARPAVVVDDQRAVRISDLQIRQTAAVRVATSPAWVVGHVAHLRMNVMN